MRNRDIRLLKTAGRVGFAGFEEAQQANPQPAHLPRVWASQTQIVQRASGFGLGWIGLDWVVRLGGFLYRPTLN